MSVLPSVENCCEVLESYTNYIIQEKSHLNTQMLCICQFHNWNVQGRCPKEFGFICVANAKIVSITVLDMCSLLIHVYSQAFSSLLWPKGRMRISLGVEFSEGSPLTICIPIAKSHKVALPTPFKGHLTSYPGHYTILLVSLIPTGLLKMNPITRSLHSFSVPCFSCKIPDFPWLSVHKIIYFSEKTVIPTL